MIITIDGPAASGKSSVAKELAKELGFYYLYTGLLYRGTAYILAEILKIDPDKFSSLTLEDLNFVKNMGYYYKEGEPQIFFEGENITEKLKNPAIDQIASKISTNKYVRQALLEMQQDIGKKYDIIADGRDCGSVVFPNADYKFFLTASLEVRARRKSKMDGMPLEEAMEELAIRDERDKSRDVAPLIVPKDAVTIDNSNISQVETLQEFLKYIDFK